MVQYMFHQSTCKFDIGLFHGTAEYYLLIADDVTQITQDTLQVCLVDYCQRNSVMCLIAPL